MRELGFRIHPHPSDPGLRLVELDLRSRS